MGVIERVEARTVLDSRGDLTVEAEVYTREGFGRASAPSGASTGSNEVTPFRNGSAEESVEAVREKVESELVGLNVGHQDLVDTALQDLGGDGFGYVGGNGAVAVSLATAKAAASERGLPLFEYLGGLYAKRVPFPLGNVVGGGSHAGAGTDIQEFLVAAEEADSARGAVLANAEVHRLTGRRVEQLGGLAGGRGDEGAWISTLDAPEILEVIRDVCDEVEARLDVRLGMGLDFAASELYDGSDYVYSDGKRDKGAQMEYAESLCDDFDLIYVEDPLEEEDFEGFAELSSRVDATVCGDDLFVTNAGRIELGVELDAADAVLIKPNQVGTLTGTWMAVETAQDNGYGIVVSHRSGETSDAYLSHVATALGSPFIKCGIVGGERVSKLNELLRIEEMI